jgi:hypothetical protein
VTAGDYTLKGKLLSQSALPPYAIEDPVPPRDACTLSSIFHPQWTFSAFQVDGNSGASSSVSFNIILAVQNRGFQYPITVSQGALLANSSWHACAIGRTGDETGEPLWPSDCSMKYVPATKELTLKSDWICTDLDPNRP